MKTSLPERLVLCYFFILTLQVHLKVHVREILQDEMTRSGYFAL